jgi:hypothetical protein
MINVTICATMLDPQTMHVKAVTGSSKLWYAQTPEISLALLSSIWSITTTED